MYLSRKEKEKTNEESPCTSARFSLTAFAPCACGNSTAPAADPTEAPAEATPEATEAPVVSEETAAVLSKWTDDLYEPETSITYSATIVRRPADAGAVETAAQDVRPNTMIVRGPRKPHRFHPGW